MLLERNTFDILLTRPNGRASTVALTAIRLFGMLSKLGRLPSTRGFLC